MALKDGDFDAVESRLKQQVTTKDVKIRPLSIVWIRLVSERNDWEKLESFKVPAFKSMLDAMQDREICSFLKTLSDHKSGVWNSMMVSCCFA